MAGFFDLKEKNMLHLGLKYGQIARSRSRTPPSLPLSKTNTPRWVGVVVLGWTEVRNEQEMRKTDKQMSARSHQLGAGILKQNV